MTVSLSAQGTMMSPQGGMGRGNGGGQNGRNQGKNEGKSTTFIKPDVRTWRMVDTYTLTDTVPVDTLTNGHQINNKIWRENVANVTLGNLGSPYKSMFYPTQSRLEGNIFYNTLLSYVDKPEDYVFYDTKTPYTNLAYTMGYPKSRSEEFVQALFTQNVNARLNLGGHYKYSTSVGRYSMQDADQVSVRFFESYNGDAYRNNFTMTYNRTELQENGGIVNDSILTNPEAFEENDYKKPDDIPVHFSDQRNRISTYQLFYAHSLDLAYVERMDADSSFYDVPVATAFHHIHMLRSHRKFTIGDLSQYTKDSDANLPEYNNNTTSTADTMLYSQVSNLFQIKLNEEFNSLLKFGLRGYIGNDVRRYGWPGPTTWEYTIEDGDTIGDPISHHKLNDGYRVVSYFGGEMANNRSEHCRWNAEAKFFFQGYKKGDFILSGGVETMFNIRSLNIDLWAKGSFESRTPEIFENKYFSNHYHWSQNLDDENILNVSAGLRVKKLKLDMYGFMALEDGKVYYNSDGIPSQDGSTRVYGGYLYKHFEAVGLNSINRLIAQYTTNSDVNPLPGFAIYSSNFYERLLFGVLTMQVGFDWHYNTRYYAPKYIPAIQQFCSQKERKVGDYHYFDPFLNFQLKRARIFVKYEHVNSGWGSKDYFHTIHYPANPQMFKFGVSWNFYD